MGAARLLRGLAEVVQPGRLTVIVNTGDDDEFYGLHVSPDLDTIVYTLGGLAPEGRGWGIRGDGFHALAALERLYGPAWFQLGDRDLATHVYRTDQLRRGRTLSEVTAEIAGAFGIDTPILPATDDRLRTFLDTDIGRLPFQRWLVAERGRPRVARVSYVGAKTARPAPGVLEAIEHADRVLVAPSNPYVSIGPILAVPGVKRALRAAAGRTVAVSPLIHGKAVKGPLADMLRARGLRPDAAAIASLYRGLAARLIVAEGDTTPAARARGRGWPELVEHDILIGKRAAAVRLARFVCA